MRRILSYDVVVPAWFLFVGVVATFYPPTTIAGGVASFVITVMLVPFLALTLDVRSTRPRLVSVEKPMTGAVPADQRRNN